MHEAGQVDVIVVVCADDEVVVVVFCYVPQRPCSAFAEVLQCVGSGGYEHVGFGFFVLRGLADDKGVVPAGG